MSNLNLIKELRLLTQAGMKDCKDALVESNFDLQKAVDIIKTKGKLVAIKNKIASEGLISISQSNNKLSMVEVNCVTDFVAKTKEFSDFCSLASSLLAEKGESFLSDIDPFLSHLRSVVKENILVKRYFSCNFTDNHFYYLHPNKDSAKIAVILEAKSDQHNDDYVELCNKIAVILESKSDQHNDDYVELCNKIPVILESKSHQHNDDYIELCNNIAMQIAAMNPLSIDLVDLNLSVLERQKAIFKSQIDSLNKPVQSHQKIMEGKLNKWFTEVCLVRQNAVFANDVSIIDLIDQFNKKYNCNMYLTSFVRWQVGETPDNLGE